MNAKLLNHVVAPFLTQNFDNAQYIGAYFAYDKGIEIHNQLSIFFLKGQIYIQLVSNELLTIELLNCFVGINAVIKNGSIFINGIQWDGKKTNLDLFK